MVKQEKHYTVFSMQCAWEGYLKKVNAILRGNRYITLHCSPSITKCHWHITKLDNLLQHKRSA